MKKIIRFLIGFLLVGLVLGVAGFLALALYYRNNFPVNTWINGVYCTGKTVKQVNEELIGAQEASTLSIVDPGGASWEVAMQEAGVRPDFTAELRKYLRQNASFYWLENLNSPVSSQLQAGRYVVDDAKLREVFEALPFVAEELEREQGVSIHYSSDGYYLQDDNTMHLDQDKAFGWLKKCLSNGQTTIRLAEGDCYGDLSDSGTDLENRRIWEKIGVYTDKCRKITYDMGAEKIEFTAGMAADFLEKDPGSRVPCLDEEGELVVSEDAVRGWVNGLAAQYDTWNTERDFTSTRGDTVTVRYGTYGTQLDREAEVAYLLDVLQGKSEDMPHVPAYLHQGYVRGLDDIGSTYIEIDMTDQKMYYYADGELILETDVITGNTTRGMGTPQGIYFVYNKERNRTLRGTGYASFVKYWVPVNGGVGIHDASWQSEFGGQLYKTRGSHGCINTPTDAMSQLYELVEVGTPVVIFY